MIKTRLKDDTFSLVITWEDPLLIYGSGFLSILTQINRLHNIVPVANYEVDRVASSDVWDLSAETVNGRAYHSTVSLDGDIPEFTHTTFPKSQAREIEAFFNLELTWTSYLKENSISKVIIKWD